MEGNCFAKRSL